jgi:hypothetical protein
MPVRPWSRLALALLLLWQLDTAVAVAAPYAPAALQATGTPATHCARHPGTGVGHVTDPVGTPEAPVAPDCCHRASAACHCAQMPALALPALKVGDVLPPDPPRVLLTAPRSDARGSDFFRPPI